MPKKNVIFLSFFHVKWLAKDLMCSQIEVIEKSRKKEEDEKKIKHEKEQQHHILNWSAELEFRFTMPYTNSYCE